MKMLAGHQHAFGIHSDDVMNLGVPSAPVAHGCCALPLGSRSLLQGWGTKHEVRYWVQPYTTAVSSFL